MGGVQCVNCHRRVGRDGVVNVETFEMSNVVAGCDGICGPCLRRGQREHPERYGLHASTQPISDYKSGEG
jgi:hypothetical protein